MIKSVFTILLCVHLLGDFYFQTQKMADKKQSQFFWTVCHCLIYGACSGLLFCFFLPGMKLRYILVFISAHAVIDIVKYAVCRFLRNRHQSTGLIESPCGRRNVFLIDQAVHMITILWISYWLGETEITLLYRDGLGILFDSFNVPESTFLKWAAVLLLIGFVLAILDAETISRLLGADSGAVGMVIAGAVGCVTLIPGYVAFPLAASLLAAGAGYAQVAIFISTLMMVGIATLPLEARYFGRRTALKRNGLSLLVAVISSLAMGVLL